jgi:hypothetical protein
MLPKTLRKRTEKLEEELKKLAPEANALHRALFKMEKASAADIRVTDAVGVTSQLIHAATMTLECLQP